MQRVTSSPDHVALNATPTEMKSRFGTYEVTWSKVTNPTGGNIVARVVNAVLAVIKNIAQSAYNAAVFVPNKIHSLLYPNAAANASMNNEDDAIEIQHDSVLVDVYETNETNGDTDVSASALEELPEPVVSGTRSRTWLKAGLVGGLALGGAAALMIASKRYDVKVFGEEVPGAAFLDKIFTDAGAYAQNACNSAYNSAYQTLADFFKEADKPTCSDDVIKDCENKFATLCPTDQEGCDLAALNAAFLKACKTAANCV